ncbi:hypothetical protein MANES_16G017966v8 [Manihot esculenta]|uniref:Uncharacterized protein n=1 Tax=Manihot esculenta TaxID=3983 RepID=A0ACB7G4P4_MANES|nr:hypothetical protein MANES_16G017966v8 [Manihot esculenta]
MALLSKNKYRFVDGTLPAPPITDSMRVAWQRYLQERFSQGDIFRISNLQEEIYAFKQGDRTVTEYFTELKILYDELMNFRPIPVCTCTDPCACGAVAKFTTYQKNDYAIRFLKGLNDRFTHVRSQIMLIDPLPSINKVFSLVVQQERQLDLGENVKVFVSAKASNLSQNRNAFYKKPSSNAKVCTYCGKQRHTVDTCYKKHGFPPGFKFRNSSINQIAVHDAPKTNESVQSYQMPATINSGGSCAPFTQEQIQQLLALIQPSDLAVSHTTNQVSTNNASVSIPTGNSVSLSCFSKSHFWLLDTGATDHICFSLSLFSSYKRIHPIHVKLPNGEQLISHFSGTISLNDDLCLTNVLYIPSFTFNLISVTKLIAALKCCLVFGNNYCLIQAMKPWRMIGTAKVEEGLYVLHQKNINQVSQAASSIGSHSFSVWHYRFGHPSTSRLKVLHSKCPSILVDHISDSCDICHLAKQKRIPFPVSQS